MRFLIKLKEIQMNNLRHVTGGAIKHATAWSDDGMLAAGYKPLMWLMALLLAAVVAGCGSGNGVPAANPPPGTTSSTVLPGVAGTTGANATNPTVIFRESGQPRHKCSDQHRTLGHCH